MSTFTFQTQPESLSVAAFVRFKGETIEFQDVAVYCIPGEDRIPIGVGALIRLLQEVEEVARQLGFRYLVITGDRHTGANPDRYVVLRRRL